MIHNEDMDWESAPQWLELKPTEVEQKAIHLLIKEKNLVDKMTPQKAVELLNEIRLNQAQLEYDALSNLRSRTRSAPYGNPKVDRYYRPFLVVVLIFVVAYVISRLLG